MFTVKGRVIKGDAEKKNLMLVINDDDFAKVVRECDGLSHVFKDNKSQPIYPAWKHTHENGITRYYCKILLSKARKEQYETLLSLGMEEKLWRVMASPYSIENAHTGVCNGVSLYYQGEYVAPKKFRVKQEKIKLEDPKPNQLEHEL